ncbi:MAG TPA: hypothetical protein DCF68_06495 [Cyanothece sp. UBA12306]|nr:hypothetical protein [Cyanothece sp. UBA12306]
MGITGKKPILVAGLGISFVLWLGEYLHQELVAIGEWGIMGAIAVGSGFWWWKNRVQSLDNSPKIVNLSLETVKKSIAKTETIIDLLAKEAPNFDLSRFEAQLNQLSASFDRQELKIAITGGKNVGKTTLKEILEIKNPSKNISLIETEALFKTTETTVIDADLILFLITGDLTNSQWKFLQKCQQNHQRYILIFNKQDQYKPEDKALIFNQIQQRLGTQTNSGDLITINSGSYKIKVRQHQEDGTVKEWEQIQPPNITDLINHLTTILAQEKTSLVCSSIWREVNDLQQQVKDRLNQVRRDRAIPIIEQYQWVAASTAFANPVASLDLLATFAITTQMVVDLSGIYQQKFTFEQGQNIAGTMGKLMVQLGLVELSTNTIVSLLKSNAVTYIAGGTVQGISAAYLTRLAGLSFIEYLQEQDLDNQGKNAIDLTKLTEKIKQVFQKNQRTVLVQEFVKKAMVRYG